MEWPAEVASMTPFAVRLTGYRTGSGCPRATELVLTQNVDQSAVTFEPYVVFTGPQMVCAYTQPEAGGIAPVPAPVYDTSVTLQGLAAPSPRTYEMRGGANVYAQGFTSLPTRTFGDITVRPSGAATGRANAGGSASVSRDTTGCLRVRAAGVSAGYVLENPPDTTSSWTAFVRGYLYQPGAPLCGETMVFHLVRRN